MENVAYLLVSIGVFDGECWCYIEHWCLLARMGVFDGEC